VTSLVEGAKRLVGLGGSDLASRLDGLERAVDASRGRLDDDLVAEAAAVVSHATSRLGLSGDHTVVALAGATGSGKSSTFNALTGLELSAVGVRRPTTSSTLVCAWGADGAVDLLDWLDVPRHHRVRRESTLDIDPREIRDLEGLVLLDLPDHDSTEVDHHLEVDRLLELADLFVWVLDPQKYADAALHQRYLRPYASHKDVMLVALNHIDEVGGDDRASMMADLERLLKADGLGGVPVIATSATRGDGIADLKKAIARRVADKKASRARLLADVSRVAERMQQASGTADPGDVARQRRGELVDAFADAAGVPTVVAAVEKATRIRAARATGWPVTSWLSRLRPDPLKRLHLDLGKQGKELTRLSRASLPQTTQVQRARVDSAVRAVAKDVSAGLTRPWADAVRRASLAHLDEVSDALDKAVSGTDLGVSRTPLWWRAVRAVQWLLIIVALVGALWLGGLAVMGYLQVPQPGTPHYRGFPMPSLMLVGGVLVGILLALLCRFLVTLAARARARSADQRLRAAITEVTDRLVVEPVQGEIAAYRSTREGLTAARG
jgi:GTP-binding protein EngB required for normal cell division